MTDDHTSAPLNPQVNASAPTNEQVNIELVWPPQATQDAQVVTHAAILLDAEPSRQGMYLLLGHLGPPAWASPGEARRQLEDCGGKLPVALRGSFFLTRARAEELWKVLGAHLHKGDQPAANPTTPGAPLFS
ncbi:hypothetical protein [Mycobacterium sp.]|uniref:hypothetical protein n=1 Tax=Mycobacterium sp. TaxID=1785 RepID=UPI003BAC72FD